jgi:hypothetical protein
MTNGGSERRWTKASIDQLLDLALLQGNRFIKELLRSKELPIGSNKQHFEEHLRQALGEGRLTPNDIQGWLGEVEGWGNQQVFAFDVPDGEADGVRSRDSLVERVEAAGLTDFLDAEIPLDPDEELALATIRHDAESLSLLWVRGSPALVRQKELDFEEEIEGNEIEFHAYERRWSRVAGRFEWQFETNLAAVFLARREERDYAQQRDLVLETVDTIIPTRADWPPLDISRVITQLDTAALDPNPAEDDQVGVRMYSTVFQGASASVRLAATSEAAGYQDDAGVRQVRLAVDPAQLVGGLGDCYLTPTADTEEERRELHLRLYGREHRVLLWGKMTAEEVWGLVTDLRAYAAA